MAIFHSLLWKNLRSEPKVTLNALFQAEFRQEQALQVQQTNFHNLAG
jgi:hypothetical protein